PPGRPCSPAPTGCWSSRPAGSPPRARTRSWPPRTPTTPGRCCDDRPVRAGSAGAGAGTGAGTRYRRGAGGAGMTGENAHRMLPVASARQTWSVSRAAFGRARGAAAATVAVSIAANLCALAAPWILGMLVDAVDQGQEIGRAHVLAAAIAVSAVA